MKTPSLAEELDNLMDISIEIASNKRMKKGYIKPFKLTFKDKDLEKKVEELKRALDLQQRTIAHDRKHFGQTYEMI